MPQPLRILLIEESVDDAEVLVRELRRGGYDVTWQRVETADALHTALANAWDVVFSDYSLSSFGAIQALKLVKEHDQDLPFIILSETVGEEAAVAVIKAGAHDYIVKGRWARLIPAVTHELVEAKVRRERRQAQMELETQSQYLILLNDITRTAAGILDFDQMLKTLANRLGELLDADGCYITLWDEVQQKTIPAAAVGPLHESYITLDVEPGEKTLTAAVMRTGKAIAINDVTGTPYISPRIVNRFPIRALLGLPLISGKDKLGAILIGFDQPHTFTPSEIARGEQAAGQIALAVAKARLYERLHNHAQDLEAEVTQRTHQLAEANEQLKELDRLKTKFVSDVSHELRTPVTNLKLYLSLIERGSPQRRERYLAVINEQTDRLEELIKAILDISRLERNAEQIVFQPVNLNELIAQVIASHKRQAELAGLQLDFQPGHLLPLVSGDATRLQQVAENLLTNALHYTISGSVQVDTFVDMKQERVCLQVVDTGIGIAPEELPLLFDRFYRGERTGQLNIPGTGLGLSIVQEIVNIHHGRIEVKSEVNQGSIFQVWLPISPAAE